VILAHDQFDAADQQRSAIQELTRLGFDAGLFESDGKMVAGTPPPGTFMNDSGLSPLEQILGRVPVKFNELPILASGESKEVRLWTDHLVLMQFKPTVYSFTSNRYGVSPGTDLIRLRFTAELFRRMAKPASAGGFGRASAFLALIETPGGPLLAQRRVDPGNLEIRIKRYHIGSPVHRYRFTERHGSTLPSGPVRPWSRFDQPVVCFDWRNPLHDEAGNRLGDEPLSDDYARVWMSDVDYAKTTAREVFLWMEDWFASVGVRLVDMCLFVDRSGHIIFGEISPDCMRVQLTLDHPARAASADKDLWRSGKSPELLLARYSELYCRLFGEATNKAVATT
jgi:phosphoribosylaminoimidazole-succinocarboxamide synthase